ncbi:MAG: hypothetical protein IPP41_09670 [Rhodocyclaceae bacterium]|nr:hypothetical protein [Rhodocyclaceae bacterium]
MGLITGVINAVRAGKVFLPGIGSGLWDVVRSSQAHGDEVLPLQACQRFLMNISASRRFAAQSYSLKRLKTLVKHLARR